MRIKIAMILLFLLAGFAVVWGVQTYNGFLVSGNASLTVVASFYPVYYFASEISGSHPSVSVTLITPAGAEPHEYELTAQDAIRIYESDLLLVNGSGFEPWLESVALNIKERPRIVAVSDGLATERTLEKGISVFDPHVWISPKRALVIAEKIADEFVAADPEHAPEYQARAEKLASRLKELDDRYMRVLADCERKVIVTAHTAFRYVAADYGFEELSIAGISPETEPSPQKLAEIVEFVKANDIPYVFFETLASPELTETLARETGTETLVLNSLEGLTREEQEMGKDYFTEMEQNVTELARALACTP